MTKPQIGLNIQGPEKMGWIQKALPLLFRSLFHIAVDAEESSPKK